MVIKQSESTLHWNYFLALEADLERLARFVEFTKDNFETYSIEIARLLQTACSEVDVLAHQLCDHFDSAAHADNIREYRPILRREISILENAQVEVPRYGLTLVPWSNWQQDKTPTWWDAHNDVKHRRDEHFRLANVGHLLNAAAGLLLLTVCFYRQMTALQRLEPPPSLLKPDQRLAKIAGYSDGGITLYFDRERTAN
jgi:hypothetical protein